jgi:hypothetical protein
MTQADQDDVDRVLAVVSDLKTSARKLEILHEIDVKLAMAFFEKAPPLDAGSTTASASQQLFKTYKE